MFTGKGSEEVASDAVSAGVTGYLQKAIGPEQYELLANRIATAVDQYRTARKLERQNDLFEKAESIDNVGAWEYDIVADTLYVSDEALRIYGLDTDEHLTPEETIEYYHPEDRDQLRRAFHNAIEEALARIETITENILTLARRGRPVDETEPVRLREVAAEAWETVETEGLTLAFDAEVELPADGERLRQLLENLFRNTVEHGEGAGTIRVGEIQSPFTATRAIGDTTDGFYVADDGVGVPENIREGVFDSGFMTDSERIGFGLAIVARIAEAHGWEVTVTESRDGGARFEFTDQPAGGHTE